MTKTRLVIAVLVLFILPVFISSYSKYKNVAYVDMNYSEIGQDYIDYFNTGVNKISVISDMASSTINVVEHIITSLDVITSGVYKLCSGIAESVSDKFKSMYAKFKDLFEFWNWSANEDDYYAGGGAGGGGAGGGGGSSW